MPGASGKDLLRTLRATQPDLPAIVVSGFTTEALDDLGEDRARYRFLAKPYSAQALLAAARELCAAGARIDGIRGARVLVVDDNPVNRMILGRFLEDAGVEYRYASSGAEAMDVLARDASFAAVLMDYELPDASAPQLVRRIRTELRLEDLPIISVTGHASDENLAECLAAGMVARVTKPIVDRELTSTLSRWAKRPPA